MAERTARDGVPELNLNRWLVGVSVGALALLNLTAPGIAQSVPAPGQSPAPSASTVTFDIPAQSLDAAIAAFGRVTGIQVLYDSALTGSLRSAAVRGTFTPAAALSRLLAPTGLSPRFTGPRTATLQGGSALPPQGRVPGDAVLLDTVVVEGEKVARDYFRTYTSIGVATGQQVYDYNVPDLQRSFDLMPNVRSFKADGGNNGFVIRGLNSEGVTQPSNAAPIISVVVDGAIQNTEATRRGARGVWDVEQIEVLRGPQSTLQGRNALGGAVVVKTRDPTYRPEFIVDGVAGEDLMRHGAFVVSAPLVQNQVAFRIAGQTMREVKDITYSDPQLAPLANDELDQLRGKLLVTPEGVPGLRMLFTVNHVVDNPAQNVVTGPNYFARRFEAALAPFSEFRKVRVNNYISDITYDLSPGWRVQSVTAFAATQTNIITPAGTTFDRKDSREGRDVSQDLRLTFDRPDAAISGVFGLFAGRFTSDTVSFIGTTAFGPPVTIQDAVISGETVSLAAYTDIRYRFWDRWTLLAGGRVLRDDVSRDVAGVGFDLVNFQPVSLDEKVESSDSVFLPKGGLAYDLAANQTIAGTVSRGYRAGFAEVVAGTGAINRVAPEFMWSYELAYRSKWLDDRLQINGNVFYYDYSDQQLAVDNPLAIGQVFTQNVGKSHVQGAEIEARARLLDGFTVFGGIGLLRTKFDEAVTGTGNFTGKEFPEAPSVTVSAGGIWRHHTGFFAGADVSYTDGYFSPRDLSNDPLRFVNAFTLVNARVGWENRYATVMLFARNLFDEQYLTGISSGLTQATIGDGRLVGVRGTLRF